jgi:hypothetical protein
MMIVPSNNVDRRPAASQPMSAELLLLAAAEMHRQGRLVEPKDERKDEL